MAHNYILRVTAGTEYDPSTHQQVAVNTAEPLRIESAHMDFLLNVRIQNYRGLPHSSPPTSPYFSLPAHSSANDQYSIAFRFTPKSASVNGDDLVFGNDFDHPIRDRLPPGFGTAFRIVKWVVDPGLDGDVYADKPYLYGPVGGSLNTFVVGDKESSAKKETSSGNTGNEEQSESMAELHKEIGIKISEGGLGDGLELRREQSMPDTEAGRKKWFLDESNRAGFEFEAGRAHWGDFFNPYLDFNDFALRLPGFTLPIMKYWDGQGLRYVLKNRKTDTVYLVVLFTLFLKEDVNEDGSIKEGVEGGKLLGGPPKGVEGHVDENGSKADAENKGEKKMPVEETSPDDVD